MPFRVPLIGCREKRHQPHQPIIGSEMPVDIVKEVPLTGLPLAETVLLHGGTVVALALNEMPTESGVAAIFRYD
jgi:hypothetical protein